MLCAHGGLARELGSLKSLSDPGDRAAIIWNILVVRGQREKREPWMFSNQQISASAWKWPSTLCPPLTKHRSPAHSRPREPAVQFQKRGGIPVQFQEGHVWLGWQFRDTNYVRSTPMAQLKIGWYVNCTLAPQVTYNLAGEIRDSRRQNKTDTTSELPAAFHRA